MKVQECGAEALPMVDMPKDPQADMIRRCLKLQQRVGAWHDDIDMNTCDVNKTLHMLDMAAQELSEAWDLVEGGWKHHKKNPDPPNREELVMELVDVAHFFFNAYLYMGGQAEQEVVAGLVARSKEQLQFPRIGLEEGWQLGNSTAKRDASKLEALYGHGDGAHGLDWEKSAATIINLTRAKTFGVTEAIREGLAKMSKKQRENFPAASGYVYVELVPWLYACAAAVPDMTQQEFYSAFVKKNDINFARQDRNY